ncbi:hypothetical protein EX30DRAFT_345107 [Ascodesmis nigricans]|uniref:Uncharacterized protein n=1 Tax=Ascodesmis nigricans TaxID=341454 RepID=A0A4S2MH68_9PEZI|nr:hypothetical protein EX30DRAFT_345107 [Ascodesmis nigricans]
MGRDHRAGSWYLLLRLPPSRQLYLLRFRSRVSSTMKVAASLSSPETSPLPLKLSPYQPWGAYTSSSSVLSKPCIHSTPRYRYRTALQIVRSHSTIYILFYIRPIFLRSVLISLSLSLSLSISISMRSG